MVNFNFGLGDNGGNPPADDNAVQAQDNSAGTTTATDPVVTPTDPNPVTPPAQDGVGIPNPFAEAPAPVAETPAAPVMETPMANPLGDTIPTDAASAVPAARLSETLSYPT